MELGKGVRWRFKFGNSQHEDISLMITLAESIRQREQVVQDSILITVQNIHVGHRRNN